MGTNLKSVPPKRCAICPVRRLGFCSALSDENIGQLNEIRSGSFTIARGDYLYQAGDPHSRSYTLSDGWVIQSRAGNDGKRQILRFALPGDFLGFQPDFDSPFNHSAIALTECGVCAFTRLDAMVTSQPKLALRLSWICACDTTLAEVHLATVAKRSARARIAFLALELYHRLELRGMAGDYSLPFPLSQEDVADALGMTVVHVNRTLHALRDEKLLELKRHRLEILDHDALCAMSGFDAAWEAIRTCNV